MIRPNQAERAPTATLSYVKLGRFRLVGFVVNLARPHPDLVHVRS